MSTYWDLGGRVPELEEKDDFDMTPENKRPGTTEERRRNRDFFHVEATVGLD